MPEYSTMFHAKHRGEIEVGCSDDDAIRPAQIQHQHSESARQHGDGKQAGQRRARFINGLAEHRAIEATLSTPDAATTRNIANTCGMPHTI